MIDDGVTGLARILVVLAVISGCASDKFETGEDTSNTRGGEASGSGERDASRTSVRAEAGAGSSSEDSQQTEPEPDCEQGQERCDCYPNDTCNDGLACLSGLCVDVSTLEDETGEDETGEDETGEDETGEDETGEDTPAEGATSEQGSEEGTSVDERDAGGEPAGDLAASGDSVEVEPELEEDGAPIVTRPSPLEETVEPPPAAQGGAPVGGACDSDAGCMEGLTCLGVDSNAWFGGGPANGYCTKQCQSDPGSCPTDSVCLGVSDEEAYCLRSCELGDVAKCEARGDLACDGFSIGEGFCRPTCRSDADCGERRCDLGVGTCVDSLPPGDPIGSPCDPEAEQNSCQSQLCLPMSDTVAVCSALCNLSYNGCGFDGPVPQNPGDATCLYGAVEGSGSNDVGLCNQRCNCDADCLHPGSACLIVPEDMWEVLGTPGICSPLDVPIDEEGFHLGRACSE